MPILQPDHFKVFPTPLQVVSLVISDTNLLV